MFSVCTPPPFDIGPRASVCGGPKKAPATADLAASSASGKAWRCRQGYCRLMVSNFPVSVSCVPPDLVTALMLALAVADGRSEPKLDVVHVLKCCDHLLRVDRRACPPQRLDENLAGHKASRTRSRAPRRRKYLDIAARYCDAGASFPSSGGTVCVTITPWAYFGPSSINSSLSEVLPTE